MRAVLFANGDLDAQPALAENDLIIAADGGAKHCLRLRIWPDYVVGDLDSLSQDDLEALESAGARIIQFPQRKDLTDLELALQHAKSMDVDEVLIYGALGRRWDQTLANIILAGSCTELPIRLVADKQELLFLHSGESLQILGNPGDTVSLIPLSGNVEGVTTQNLEYSLKQEPLAFGRTRGVSNVLLNSHAQVAIKEGLLVIVVIHHDSSANLEENHDR